MSQPYYATGVSPRAWGRNAQTVGSMEFQRLLIEEFSREVKDLAEKLVGHLRTDMTYVAASHLLPAHAEWMERQWREKIVTAVLSAISLNSSSAEDQAEVSS